ncbi:hypothetical protein GCM10010266_74050 [Streptomyces griseomycini]|nr:hypothetical protein GCM10010266_74050 [Streptomyces griseomycini]GGR60147.1 hypothetical protein GCM10015536_75430 [Streptomyces griseomycini]
MCHVADKLLTGLHFCPTRQGIQWAARAVGPGLQKAVLQVEQLVRGEVAGVEIGGVEPGAAGALSGVDDVAALGWVERVGVRLDDQTS